MPIVTFWSNGKEQTGKTLSIAAIATYMAIEHDQKMLIVSTAKKHDTLARCFLEEKKQKGGVLDFLGLKNTHVDVQAGIDGLIKLAKSNKLEPKMITNYTKIIFKDRLEILPGYDTPEDISNYYLDIINTANSYYDLVFVDLDASINELVSTQILKQSNLVVASLSQRLESIQEFQQLCKTEDYLNPAKTLFLISRYDKYSKYNSKNIARYINRKKEVLTIPYNTLYFEAAEESKVPDMFLKFKKMGTDMEDRNTFFISEVQRASEDILYKLHNIYEGM